MAGAGASAALFDDDDEDEWVRDGVKSDVTPSPRKEVVSPTGSDGKRPLLERRGSTASVGSAAMHRKRTSSISEEDGGVSFQQLLRTHATCACSALGGGVVDAPNSKNEINRIITSMHVRVAGDPDVAKSVLLCIPRLSGGLIYIVDKTSYAILEKFSIKRILFCAGGEKQTASLGFTTVLETEETDGAGPAELFECHVFDFPAKDKMDLAMAQIAASFGNFDQSDEREGGQMDALRYDFEVSIAVCEHDPTTGKWSHCPFFKGTFKLRSTTGRLQFTFTLTQTSKQSLLFDSGFSVSIGKTLSVEAAQTDELRSEAFIAMQMVSSAQSDRALSIVAEWVPPEGFFYDNGTEVDALTAIDLALTGVREPLRLEFPTPAKVVQKKGKLAAFHRHAMGAGGSLRAVTVRVQAVEEPGRVVYSVKSVEQAVIEKSSYMAKLAKLGRGVKGRVVAHGDDAPGHQDSAHADEDDDDLGEDDLGVDSSAHVLSGMGKVSRDMSENAIEAWGNLLVKWDAVTETKRRAMARKGVPDALRHQVWKRLLGEGAADNDLIEAFPHLCSQKSDEDMDATVRQQITWDLSRTFPGNEFFAEDGGKGQQALYRICKAYSIYDEEIGYCQGQSFIAAVLLLKMPEEEAFVTFIKLMFDINVREMYKAGFADLQLKFFQLGRLVEELLPDLHAHFQDLRIETHMFASQWFLTLFAAKFPLVTTCRVFDVLLSEGTIVLYQIAVALLKLAKKDLLSLEFEEVLQYFRVTVPRTYCDDASASTLISTASRLKGTAKRLSKYEIEYFEMKAAEAEAQDPMTRLQEENARLQSQVMRLEAENELMANDLVSSKIEAQSEIERLDVSLNASNKAVDALTTRLAELQKETDEEKERLLAEGAQVKDMFREVIAEAEASKATVEEQRNEAERRLQLETARFETDRDKLEKLAKIGEASQALAESGDDKLALQNHVHELENEIAESKSQLGERDLRIEQLEQKLRALEFELEQAKAKKWFRK